MDKFEDSLENLNDSIMGRYEEDLRKSLKINPNKSITLDHHGLSYQDMEKYEGSFENLTRSLKMNQTHCETLNNRAITYLRMALEIKLNSEMTLNDRGVTYHVMTRNEELLGLNKSYDESIKDLNDALEIKSSNTKIINRNRKGGFGTVYSAIRNDGKRKYIMTNDKNKNKMIRTSREQNNKQSDFLNEQQHLN
ncbi:hypothetical protein C2G38_2163818 [Gigaspora rosea]|uniref:Uncharacterized protein n=1 Tax=Gigaspora rosea TaxID=44941 RepID=A0A397VZ06_9GLOM|nr:hypothetical protein C2G38_2163818 [Gigaspora rosea]